MPSWTIDLERTQQEQLQCLQLQCLQQRQSEWPSRHLFSETTASPPRRFIRSPLSFMSANAAACDLPKIRFEFYCDRECRQRASERHRQSHLPHRHGATPTCSDRHHLCRSRRSSVWLRESPRGTFHARPNSSTPKSRDATIRHTASLETRLSASDRSCAIHSSARITLPFSKPTLEKREQRKHHSDRQPQRPRRDTSFRDIGDAEHASTLLSHVLPSRDDDSDNRGTAAAL